MVAKSSPDGNKSKAFLGACVSDQSYSLVMILTIGQHSLNHLPTEVPLCLTVDCAITGDALRFTNCEKRQ